MKVQALKYLKIGTCPASQKVLAYMGKKNNFTRPPAPSGSAH